MRRFAAVAVVIALGAARSAVAQEAKPDDARLDELEKKLSEQQREIEALREARRAPVQPDAVAAASSAAPTYAWGYKDGFFVRGEIGGTDYELRPLARVQLDYRAYPHSQVNRLYPHAVPEDEFLVRRARLGFAGSFGDFSFMLEADLVRSGLPLAQFWLQYSFAESLQVRFGHVKTPFDLDDSMTSDSFTDTIERPMVVGGGTAVAPSYRPGFEVLGSFEGRLLNYWVGAVNQVDANAVTTGDPLIYGRVESDVERTFFLGAGAYFTRSGGPVQPSFAGKTPGQFQWFTPVSVRGWQQAYTVDVSVYRGPFWAIFEVIWAEQERRRVVADGTDGAPLVTQGGYLTLGWKLLGPPARATPSSVPFAGWEIGSLDIEKRRNGRNVGLELVVRLEWCGIGDARGGRRFTSATETTPASPATAANAARVNGDQCRAITVGLNLNPIENVKFAVDWVHLRIADRERAERAFSRQGDEFLFRAQLDF